MDNLPEGVRVGLMMDRIIELVAIQPGVTLSGSMVSALLQAAKKDREELIRGFQKSSHEIEQTLGRALGYPWFKDDRKNFPGATEEDGVCVGDHVAESLAAEAAKRIKELEDLIARQSAVNRTYY